MSQFEEIFILFFLVSLKICLSLPLFYANSPLQIRFLGDPSAKFTEALDLSFDGSAIFGGNRSKRYVLVIEAGKVKEVHVEPDNTGVNGKDPSLTFLPLLQKRPFLRHIL